MKYWTTVYSYFCSETQSQLPASGVPVTRQRFDMMKDIFDEYVRDRTTHNWKFWIVSFKTLVLVHIRDVDSKSTVMENMDTFVWFWGKSVPLFSSAMSIIVMLSKALPNPPTWIDGDGEECGKRNDLCFLLNSVMSYICSHWWAGLETNVHFSSSCPISTQFIIFFLCIERQNLLSNSNISPNIQHFTQISWPYYDFFLLCCKHGG